MAEKVGEQQEGRRRRRPLLGKKAEPEQIAQPAVPEKGITAPKGRATPSRRREEEEEEEGGNIVTRTGGGLREYLEGVSSELKKVAWPTREEVIRLTIIVLGTLVAGAIILGLISATFTELFRIGLSSPLILLVVLFAAVGIGAVVYRTRGRRA